MHSRPKLPSRHRPRRGRSQPSEDAVHAPDIVRLKQQLLSHLGFQQFAEQPDKLAAIIQSDPVLQQAAAANPELAHLLDPATMQQALQVLMLSDSDLAASAAPQLHRKALMQLQNYAVQLQQARASGTGLEQQPRAQNALRSTNSGASAAESRDAHSAAATDQQQRMWALVQQRFNKLQQRSQMIGAAGFLPHQQQQQQHPAAPWPAGLQPLNHQQQPRVLETLVESPLAAGTPVAAAQAVQEIEPTGGTAASAAVGAAGSSSEPRLSDGTQTMQELLAAFPDMLGSHMDPPLWDSHGTIGLLSAVEPAPAPPTAAAGSAPAASLQGDVASYGAEVSPQQPVLSGEVSTALPLSPHWQQPQQQQQIGLLSSDSNSTSAVAPQSTKSVWPLSSSEPAVSAAAAPPVTDSSSMRAAGTAAAVVRPASVLGHRILRPHSSSPIPLGSGSTPLGIAQLGSGELIVDITPPTRITTQLSWSLDPDASYVLDASTSGSLVGQAAATAPATGSDRSAVAAADPGSAGSLVLGSGSLEGLSTGLGAQSSGQLSSYLGVVVSTDPQVNEPGSTGSAAANIGVPRLPARAATAAGTRTAGARVSSGSSRSSSSSSSRERGPRQQPGAATAAAVTATGESAAVGSAAHSSSHEPWQQSQYGTTPPADSSSSNHMQQQQPALPVSHAPYRDPQYKGTNGYSVPSGPSNHPGDMHPVMHQGDTMHQAHRSQQQSHGFSGPAATGASMLHPGTYYEDVEPSMWKPGDGFDGPGDYLDLYRRAYCSYADAFFPPVWLGLIGILASSHLLAFWQVLLVGMCTFWPGMYVMAVRWAGVPTKQLSLSRVAPMMVVSLEVICVGVYVLHILPAMWLGHAAQCLLILVLSVTMLGSHLMAYLQDPGYIPLPDEEEGPYPGTATGSYNGGTGSMSAAVQQSANGFTQAGKQPGQQQQQEYSGAPRLAGKSLTGCWTCGVEKNLRSKHCPVCKRCVERFDHHCPVIGNCVGAKNHKIFVTYLMTLVICQLLFVQLLGGMLVTQHVTQFRHTHSVHDLVPEGRLTRGVYLGRRIGTQMGRRVQSLAASPATAAAETDQIKSDLAVGSSASRQESAAKGTSAIGGVGSAVGNGLEKPSVAQAGSTTSNIVSNSAGNGVDNSMTDRIGNRALTDEAAAASNADYSANIVLVPSTTGGIDGHISTAATHVQQQAAISAGNLAGSAGSSSSHSGKVVEAVVTNAAHADAADYGEGPSSSNSRAAEVELLLARGSWSWQGCWLLLQALYTAAESSTGLLLLLLLQGPALFFSCSLLLRALFLAAANLTVNEWLNRHRYLYLQHTGAGYCNRFDRGPAHNCWEFWCGPAVVDWWQIWQQADEEMKQKHQSVLTAHSATVLIRFWDVRWAKYQQKLVVARDRRRERQLQRRMVALGLADHTIYLRGLLHVDTSPPQAVLSTNWVKLK